MQAIDLLSEIIARSGKVAASDYARYEAFTFFVPAAWWSMLVRFNP